MQTFNFLRTISNYSKTLATDVMTVLEEGASLEDSSLASFNETVNDLGGGTLSLTQKAGAYIVVIAFIFVGFKLIFSDAGNRSLIKSELAAKVVGAVLVFGAIAIVCVIEGFGKGLFQ